MSYEELRSLGVTVRPWSKVRPTAGNRSSPFSASFTSTIELLATELRALGATNVVLELDIQERELRNDGLPRANARPSHPAVAISFESRFGPLRYETCEYAGSYWRGGEAWHANLRAIALSMQALRAVDRHGVSKRGEQYQGWRALPQSTDPTETMTAEQAETFLAQWDGDWKRAAHDVHPDHGGDASEFRKVMRAKELLRL